MQMKKIPWNIRRKWILGLYVFLVVLIIVSVIVYDFSNRKLNTEDSIANSQQAVISQLAQNIDLRLTHIDKTLYAAAEQPEVLSYFQGSSSAAEVVERVKSEIKGLKESETSVESVYFCSLKSGTVISERGIYPIDSFYDTEWMNATDQLLSRREIWTTPREIGEADAPGERKRVVSLLRTYPLITTPEKLDGYVVINIYGDLLNQIVMSSLKGTESSFLILNRQSEVLFKSQNYFSYAEQDVIAAIESKGEGATFVDNGGQEMMIQSMDAGMADWTIVSVAPYTDLTGRVDMYRTYNIFIGLAVSLFMILAILFSSKWMYAPIEQFLQLIMKNSENRENAKPYDFDELGNMFLYMLEQQKDMRKQINSSIPYIKYRIMTQILTKQITDYSQLDPQMGMIKCRLYPANYIVLLTDLDNKDILDVTVSEEESDVYLASLYNKAEELSNQECQGFCVQLPDQMCLTLLSFEEDNLKSNSLKALNIAESLGGFMDKYYGITVTTAIGDYYTSFAKIADSYQDALRLIKYKPIMGNNSIITTDDVQMKSEVNMQRVNGEMEKLLRAFESMNKRQTFALLDSAFKAMKEERFPSDAMIEAGMQIVRSCMIIYSGQELELNDGAYQSIYLSLNQLDTAEEMKDFISHLLDEMLEELLNRSRDKNSDELIAKVVDYVDRSYAEYNMSLNLLADKFGLSIPYLSKIFKAYTQKTFTDYLIEIRIKKAAELLVTTSKKVGEISEMVGYPNPSSFIRIFKKYYFMTPIDYRNRHKAAKAK